MSPYTDPSVQRECGQTLGPCLLDFRLSAWSEAPAALPLLVGVGKTWKQISVALSISTIDLKNQLWGHIRFGDHENVCFSELTRVS